VKNSPRRPPAAIPAESKSHIAELRAAYERGNLTLYLGAGVSKGNGLPTWSQLVLMMYFTAMEGDWKYQWRPYPNYLFAIAEWQLRQRPEPPEVTAQKVRQYYQDPREFLEDLRTTLYVGGNFYGSPEALRNANPLLEAVSNLCRKTQVGGAGIQGVVTYNYDDLLEKATQGSRCKFVPVWKSSEPLIGDERPIFHVHGFIPLEGTSSEPDHILFTEAQYHSAANDPYSWSNLCQIQSMSSSVGLMIGLSLTDSNMRRLLSALRTTPLRKRIFALLKKPEWPEPSGAQLDAIHERAREYLDKFERSGVKAAGGRNNQMLEIIKAVNQHEQASQTQMLENFGITPIWYDEYANVPPILDSIRRARS
jgi:SIR2-like domain